MSTYQGLKDRLKNSNIQIFNKKQECKLTVEKDVNLHFLEYINNWEYEYYFLVGGYGSSKSYNTALKILLKLYSSKEKITCTVVREVYATLKDSCLSLFEEIIEDFSLHGIEVKQSPMRIVFKNGSKIIFKGMDKPAKLKSIHNVSIVWIEECSEVKYAGFKELIGRLRHPKLKLHMILTTNPVAKSNWCFKHFFENIKFNDEDLYKERIIVKNSTYYHHSIADDNNFLPESYIKKLDEIKIYDLDLYRIARKGHFGVNGVKVLPQFTIDTYDNVMEAVHGISSCYKFVGMDFGFEVSYNAVLRMAVDHSKKILYIYWEYYKKGDTDNVTAENLKEFKESRELIKADSAEPKTIKYFKDLGFNMKAAKKFAGSRIQYTKKCKRFYKIVCADTCKNTIAELKDLTFKVDEKTGEIIEDEFNIDPHTFSAMWYGLDKYEVANLKGMFNKAS